AGGARRAPALPAAPTMMEGGSPYYLLSFWPGFRAPAGTPPELIGRLNGVINDGLSSAEAKHSLAKFNVEPNLTSPEGFGAFLAAEARKWAEIVRTTNIKVE